MFQLLLQMNSSYLTSCLQILYKIYSSQNQSKLMNKRLVLLIELNKQKQTYS